MEERVDPADVTVEGPEEAPERFPIVGRDKTPTPEDLAAGRHGNGAWDLTDASVEIAYAEVQQAKKQDADERRKFFNEAAKDALADAILFHHRIVKRGLDVMDRIEKADEERPVTAKDMQVLAMAQKSSKELADRGIGRAAATQTEQGGTKSLLALIRREPNA